MQTAVMGGWQKLGVSYPRGGPQNTALAMVEAIEHGCRLLAVHYMASDCALLGASRMAEPFFRAARRCGFTDEQLLRVDVDARDEDVA